MAREADFEIVLAYRDDGRLNVSLAFDLPRSVDDKRQIVHEPISIDTGLLDRFTHDADAYGRELSDQLFRSDDIREFFVAAQRKAREKNLPLRLRISVDQEAPPGIRAIRWETLRDPQDQTPLALRRDVRVVRYLSGADWNDIELPRKHALRALVVIANPSDYPEFGDPPLQPVDVAAERERAERALAGIPTEVFASGGTATLDKMLGELERGIDILYLVCHGQIHGEGAEARAVIYLEHPDGRGHGVEGDTLVRRLQELERKPTIAVLASCQSGGGRTIDGGSLVPLGPELARVGVPAVVAMQDDITMETAGPFLDRFFEELQEDGIVDRAVAMARGAVRGRHDWWVPILFSRFKRGRTYYSVGLADELKWNAIIGAIRDGVCTPVLGPGLAEPLLGRRAELAAGWVERWLLPIPEPQKYDLTAVAQYVRAGLTHNTSHREFASHLVASLADDARYRDLDRAMFDRRRTAELIREIGARARAREEDESHSVMASLDLPVYVTTSWTDLLEEALVARGRRPDVQFFDWNGVDVPEARTEDPPPSVEKPLVYHLFGRLDQPRSLVLTEDDYFEWLVAWSGKRQKQLPAAIYDALIDQPLMFIGYRLDDWDFRVLFQSLKTFEGRSLLAQNDHVGVQLDPSIPGVEPESAQDYLEEYFQEAKVAIYWGTTKEFLRELATRRAAAA